SPMQPWLEPDVCDVLRRLAESQVRDVVVAPIGFVSDHLEVVYDLDTQAKGVADELGLNFVRAGTVGTHPRMIDMLAELIAERLNHGLALRVLGHMPPCPDVCPDGCCLPRATTTSFNR